MIQIQYDFFKSKEESEIEAFEKKIAELEKTLSKVRKGTYAAISEIKKENIDLRSRLEVLERNICSGNQAV